MIIDGCLCNSSGVVIDHGMEKVVVEVWASLGISGQHLVTLNAHGKL